MKRRGFLATVIAPIVAAIIPRSAAAEEAIAAGINPFWDGVYRQMIGGAYSHGPDVMLCSRSTYEYLNKRMELSYDDGAKWVGYKFVKPTGGKWQRVDGGLRYPERNPRLPA